MINANELRLGNIVSYKGIIGKVTWIQQDCIIIEYQRQNDLSNGSMVSPELLDGVEITEELLFELGFKKNGFYSLTKSVSLFDEVIKQLVFNGDYLYLQEQYPKEPSDLITIWNKDVKRNFYLHELQNLYLCLVQKELDTTKLFD